MELVVMAEELIQKWEDTLGPLKNLRSDLYGPGGRLEGVMKIADGKKINSHERDDVRIGTFLGCGMLMPFRRRNLHGL